MCDSSWLNLKPFDDYQINKYLVLVSVSITIYMVILLNKAHYWVLKQHTDSTPQLLVQEVSPLNGHSLYHHYRVPAATQPTIPAFCLPCKSDFRDSHHKVSFLNPSTITNRQPEIPSSKKPKHYTIESQSNRSWLGETPKKTLRFFLLAAATHTTIQTPKHPCNPKKGEVEHKMSIERAPNTRPNTKIPSQYVSGVLNNL